MRATGLLTMLLLCSAACDAATSEAGPDAGPALDDGDDDVSQPVTLTISEVEATSELLTIPVRGTGPAGGVLRYTASLGGGDSAPIGASGTFCTDVRLVPGSQNTFVFEAMSSSGGVSDPVTISITHLGDALEEPIDESQLFNLAEGASDYEIHSSFEEGEFGDLVDGNKFNHASILNDGNLINLKDFLVFRLPERGRIEKMVVHSQGDCVLKKYDLFVSDQERPDRLFGTYRPSFGDKEPLGVDWVRVAAIDDGAQRQDVPMPLGSGVAQWVGIHFQSHDCGDYFGPFETTGRHKISEIEVLSLGEATATMEDDGSPRCVDPSSSQ